MFKKSTLSVIGLVCMTIWTLGLTGCSDSQERVARKQLMDATQQADEFCRAASAEMVNPSFDKDAPKTADLLTNARNKLTAAISETSQYATELPEELALAKTSLAQIEALDAQYKFITASQKFVECYAAMGKIFDLFMKAQSADSDAQAAKQQTSFDDDAFAAKIEKNAATLKETQNRLGNINAALAEKKSSLATLTAEMNEKSLRSQTLLRESQKLPAGQSKAKLNEALQLNEEIGKIQQNLTKLESESSSLATLIESLELKVKSLQEYGESFKNSQKTMSDMAADAKARAGVLDIAAADARKKLAEKCNEFQSLQKELCENADACQNGFEKSSDLFKRALQNASEEFKNSMQLKQAELALSAASIELDMITYKKQVEKLQDTLNKGGMNIVIDEGVKGISSDALANAASTNCQEAISVFERTLRNTASKGKWRMHSALASANIMLSRALRISGKTSLADSALKTAEDQIREARSKSQWLAKSTLDAIEAQIKQAK